GCLALLTWLVYSARAGCTGRALFIYSGLRTRADDLVDSSPRCHGGEAVSGRDPDHPGFRGLQGVVEHGAAVVAATHRCRGHIQRQRTLYDVAHGERGTDLSYGIAPVHHDRGRTLA